MDGERPANQETEFMKQEKTKAIAAAKAGMDEKTAIIFFIRISIRLLNEISFFFLNYEI